MPAKSTEKRELRRGWTTGACAAAASRAAFAALLSDEFPDPVTIELPGGERPSFPLALTDKGPGWARAGIVKDAGDDPDVTHGALVVAELRPGPPGRGILFRAGEGVGVVTKPGLPLPVGEPAINPAPRAMIRKAIAAAGAAAGLDPEAEPDLVITLSIPNGAALAARTMNSRLGILGGLSILGTTGIVIPYSCSAWIHSIHRGVDVARAAGFDHIGASTGSTSEAVAARLYALPETALIDMGDFAGGLLKYLRRHPVRRLTLAGGFGKMAKLASGHLDLHSGKSRVETGPLAAFLADSGARAETVRRAREADSGAQILALAREAGLDGALALQVARGARETALATLAGQTLLDVLVVGRDGSVLARLDAPGPDARDAAG